MFVGLIVHASTIIHLSTIRKPKIYQGPAAVTPATFREQIADLSRQLAGRALDASLDAWLNREHGADSATYRALKSSCIAGVEIGRAHV